MIFFVNKIAAVVCLFDIIYQLLMHYRYYFITQLRFGLGLGLWLVTDSRWLQESFYDRSYVTNLFKKFSEL